MRTISILGPLVVAIALAVPAAAAPGRGATGEAKLQRALDELVAAGVPGAVALVREGDRTIRLASGYANLKPRTRMRVTDRFRVGSSTKTFVATLVLQLVGERKLRLDDTVERWLPGLVPNGRAITVRRLLNHTSGLYRNRTPCGFFWGHGGGTPGYSTEALLSQDGRRQFVLLVNRSDELLSPRAQEAHFRALALANCG